MLLKVHAGEKCNDNVFGVKENGSIKWQIENIIPEKENSPFVNIKKLDGRLDAYNWSGVKFQINLENGKIVHKAVTK